MILSREFFSKYGASLGVASFFIFCPMLSFAQQGNYQAALLSQIQAMQQEIAELRDMVERQDYEIRQLQRSNDQANQQFDQSQSNIAAPTYQDSSVYSQPSQPLGNLPIGNPQAYPSAEPLIVGQNQTSFPQPVESLEGGYQVYENTGGQVYQDPVYQDPSYQQVPQVGTTTIIEERVISQQPVVSQSSNGAPVEERIVGGSFPQQVPVAVNQVPVVNQVPSGTQSGFPVSNQPSVSSRQPIPNNIPNANSQTGGVVTIPQNIPQQQVPQQVIGSTVGSTANTVQQNTASLDERSFYQQGFELLNQSKHDEAVAAFKQQISSFPNGDYSDDAHYWIAESLYVNRELDQSKLYYRSIVDNFPESSRVPDAMLKTAYIEQEQGNQIEARILLQEIMQYHPRSNAAISAKNRLVDIQ